MNVLLVNPPLIPEERYGNVLGKMGPRTEPLGLACLAACLRQKGHSVKIIDALILNYTDREMAEKLKEQEYDIIGVPILTPMYLRSKQVILLSKQVHPKSRIVVGGAHATVLPSETMEDVPEIDWLVVSEGEDTLCELVERVEKNEPVDDIKGLAHRKNGEVVFNQSRPLIRDLDRLPMPAHDLLPMNLYVPTASRYKRLPSYCIMVARGCPYQCAYCSQIFGRTHRTYSVDRVIEEINIMINKYGAKEINFEGDTMTFNRKYVHRLCDAIIEEGINRKIEWVVASTRVDCVDKEMLLHMKRAGCWLIAYGIETGSQRLLDMIQKRITLDQIRDAIRWTREAGIRSRGFFMLGLPTETREESIQTIKFAKELDPYWAQFTITTPFPKTPLYELAQQDGTLKSTDWRKYLTWIGWTTDELVYVPSGRTSDELKELQRRALREFYLRPKIILRFLFSLSSMEMLGKSTAGASILVKSYFKTLFDKKQRSRKRNETQ